MCLEVRDAVRVVVEFTLTRKALNSRLTIE
jgi:hypothetical protein